MCKLLTDNPLPCFHDFVKKNATAHDHDTRLSQLFSYKKYFIVI